MKLTEFLRARHRLMLAATLGLATAVLLPSSMASIPRLLLAWNVFTWCYLLLVWTMMLRADDRHFDRLAQRTDEKAHVVLSLVSGAAVMSLLAIFLELARVGTEPGTQREFGLWLTGATVVGSWLLVPTAFALHYAHLYYSDGGQNQSTPPLVFPEPGCTPDYWDFLYFSFTIAVAAQTAEVACASRTMRKTVLAQSLLTFVFNTSILALMVNIAASLAFSN